MIVAIVQDGPAYNQLDQCLEKANDLVFIAKKNKADLIVFGESWFSGYPVWIDYCKDVNLWDHEPIKKVWSEMYRNSVDLKSSDLSSFFQVLKDNKMYAVAGLNEKITSGKGNKSIYNAVLTIGPNGEILNHHRKLMPTYTEKLVYALGDGAGLNAVDTSFGRLGSLICWEHWMPMSRQAMHDQAEDLHIALWPFVKEANHLASRHYAIEGRCHVVAVGQVMHLNELPSQLEISESITLPKNNLLLSGGSAVYGPNGDIIQQAVYDSREMIFCELELSSNIKENMNLAVSGHYQRDDVFSLNINKVRKTD